MYAQYWERHAVTKLRWVFCSLFIFAKLTNDEHEHCCEHWTNEQTKDSLDRMETACLCNCVPFEPSRGKNRTEVEIDLISREIVFYCYCWVNANRSYWLKDIVLCSLFSRSIPTFNCNSKKHVDMNNHSTNLIRNSHSFLFSLFLSAFFLPRTQIRFIDLGVCKRIHITESANRSPFCDAWAVARSITFATAQTFTIRTPELGRLRNLQFVEQFSKYDGIKWRRSLNSHTHTHNIFTQMHMTLRSRTRTRRAIKLQNANHCRDWYTIYNIQYIYKDIT